ncbi:MAG: LacI family DNA-binding transcriptional regulator, partial [Candidatus Hydrogenedentes bacterium]|nr:LacI family DNA-binding transcriptional regulator [Candidatus Hydrogenedentota bacterium]
DTRARVARIIEEVGYYPHTGARSMRSRTRDCLGVTLPAPTDEVRISQSFFIWLFNELYRIFSVSGNYVCFDLNPYGKGRDSDYARGLWEQRYGGCLLCGPLRNDDRIVGRVHESGHPYLALGRLDALPECSCATVDYEEGAYLSAKQLIERGHQRIAMLKAFSGYQPGVERLRGYRRALEEAGLKLDEGLVRSVTFGTRDITNAVYRLLLDPSVTALIDCSATEDGSSIREGARRAGRVLGEDCEVVAWTYTDNAAVLSEACAHVWLPVREAAAEGLELLAKWFREQIEGPIQVVYRPTLYETVANGEVPKPTHLFDVFS